jgi:hypothetical protein
MANGVAGPLLFAIGGTLIVFTLYLTLYSINNNSNTFGSIPFIMVFGFVGFLVSGLGLSLIFENRKS